MVELEIDGKKVEVPEGSMVIQAAHKVNTYIPHFCYHKKLSIAANCRMCLVEINQIPKALPACATPVSSGMVVRTMSDKAVKAQQSVMEFLLINHPLDCPICDQGGECQLQDLAVGYGKSASRYSEEKRIVFHKNVGPLISMEEMTRCIHCTRCVRFGQEVSGIMELGMLGRGERSEIATFLSNTVDSELSGNMIDLCPVGAITSKLFHYSARSWELSHRYSVSPHDSVGANLIVHSQNHRVMRVLPLENEEINECWISDKDRFSYEALNSTERLTQPMLRQGGKLCEVDWDTALSCVISNLKNIQTAHGSNAIATIVSPHSTLEELFLLKRLTRGLGSANLDFRLRQTDFSMPAQGVPWLGIPLEMLSIVDSAFVIGSFLRCDHPLIAVRLRQAAASGSKVSLLHASADDSLINIVDKIVVPPSAWVDALASVAVALAEIHGISIPVGLTGVRSNATTKNISISLSNGKRRVILLGASAVNHPEFSKLYSIAQWIAKTSGATLGFLPEAANTVGAYLIGALPDEGGANAAQAFSSPYRSYILFNVEPQFDVANPWQARTALAGADMIIALSSFKTSADYIDVLLPIAPFTETAGTFINAEGKVQPFGSIVRPLGKSKPGWKVLSMLGNLLGLPDFDYASAEEIATAALGGVNIKSCLSNTPMRCVPLTRGALTRPIGTLERISDVSIYDADALVRRASSLHMTKVAKASLHVFLPTVLFKQLRLKEGDAVRVRQGEASVVLAATRDERLHDGVVRIPAATSVSAELGSLFGNLLVEKA
ncbi:NADH-quinone oxidoreductase subunit NuoG [Candidatus Vallotia lariciata]|uniref:NADH-quinone oxidoreductase subunit NuoG n=1 Tax=Candidatus Vallotia laricis TaxID=2018052 RepID=UPI001D0285F4|nr:NADH-quinone oxidoreductase subunit NuoG [Candidatus Vallotia lariciata]UDG82941.1 NADH-quinone oxidoreductase chain 3 [Candidatus Vallotia lariciata]